MFMQCYNNIDKNILSTIKHYDLYNMNNNFIINITNPYRPITMVLYLDANVFNKPFIIQLSRHSLDWKKPKTNSFYIKNRKKLILISLDVLNDFLWGHIGVCYTIFLIMKISKIGILAIKGHIGSKPAKVALNNDEA